MKIHNLRFHSLVLVLVGVFALTLLSACAAKAPVLKNLAKVKPNEVVLVGKIKLDPPLGEEEQDVNTFLSPNDYKNAYFAGLTAKPIDFGKNVMTGGGIPFINESFGETFYSIVKERPVIINQVSFTPVLNSDDGVTELLIYDIWFKVDVRPEDKVVYVGTIVLTRNDYLDLTKVSVLDHFKEEKSAFEKRFGTKYPVVKRLAAQFEPKL